MPKRTCFLNDNNGTVLKGVINERCGDYPHLLFSLDCGIETGFEIANGKLRVLIYRDAESEPQIITLGNILENGEVDTVGQDIDDFITLSLT